MGAAGECGYGWTPRGHAEEDGPAETKSGLVVASQRVIEYLATGPHRLASPVQ